MTREKVGRIIDYSKDLGLSLSIVFSINGVQEVESIDFNSQSFYDVWIANDDKLMFYDEINRRWVDISIARIESINIHEKVIFQNYDKNPEHNVKLLTFIN